MTKNKVAGVVLAGGLARRMQQQDKGLVLFKNREMISYAIAAMQPLVDQLLINANRNIDQYQQFGFPVISDQTDSFDGPLAGVLAAMEVVDAEILLVTPCDSPLLESKHLLQLLNERAAKQADIAVAFDGERLHPVFLALKTDLQGSLKQYLQQGERKIDRWLKQHQMVTVDFSQEPDLFLNINTLSELQALQDREHE